MKGRRNGHIMNVYGQIGGHFFAAIDSVFVSGLRSGQRLQWSGRTLILDVLPFGVRSAAKGMY